MKKKFFFKFFLFTVIATMVTFTACKDYDDDISDLQNQITNLSSMSADLTAAKADIAAAKTSAADALAKAKEALEAAQNAGDADAIAAAQAAADAAQEKADEVETKATELEGLIQALEARVVALEAADNVSQDDLDALAAEMQALKDQIAEMGGLELNNLVLIPDYVFEDGATGIALFNQLDAGECGMISAPTTLRYRVSPTSASEEMIDVEGMRFEFNAPKTRAEEAPKFTAEFVSLKDGVLTVKAHMATDALKDLDEGKLPQIQLIVPTTPNEEVISDWVSVQTEKISNLYIANSQFEANRDEGFDWSEYAFFTDLADLKADTDKLADHVVQIKYDQSFDLIAVANTLFGDDEELNLVDYGLTYNFDLKYTDGDEEKDIEYPLTANKTDQQDFINLSDEAKGTVKSKVYTNENSRTAIGRTPIVRVQLMNDDCVVETAYIKISWVEDIKEPIPALELDLDVTKDYVCEGSIVVDEEVTVEWMNTNVYSHFDLTKEEFHNAYDLVYLVDAFDADGEKLAKGGNTYEKEDEGTEATHLFKWFFNPSDNGITPESNVVIGHINYVEKGTDKVAVTIEVTLTIEFPEFSLHGLNTTLWNADRNVFTVNPQVYKSTDATEVNIFANLLRGFINEDNITPVDLIDMIKSSVEGVIPSSVSFVFDEDKLENYKYFIDGEEYSIAKGNLELESPTKLNLGGLRAATIVGNEIKLYNDGETATNESKALVGQRVPVKVVVDQCGDGKVVSSVKDFEVFFIDPMTINADVKENFKDAVKDGSRIKVVDALTFTDWQDDLVKMAVDPLNPANLAEELGLFYKLQNPVWELENATTNLKKVGDDLVPTEGFEDGPLEGLGYRIEVEDDELVFYNDGEKLINSFVIYVPVSVNHKWGTVTDRIAITVEP